MTYRHHKTANLLILRATESISDRLVAMNSVRTIKVGSFVFLMSLWIVLQAFPASSQSRSYERHPGNLHSLSNYKLQAQDSRFPTTDKDRYQKALVDFRAGRLKEAAQELRPLHSAIARNELGIVLEAMGDHDAALAAFQSALQLQPDFEEAAYNAAKLLIRAGRPRAAIAQLQSALKGHHVSHNTTFSLQLLLAETDAYVGENKRAVEILKALVAEKPDSAEAHYDLALTYAHSGSIEAAVTQFREELRLKPKDCAALMGLAKALLNLKKSSGAVPYLQKYVRFRPNDGQGYYVLGYAWSKLGRSKDAIKEFSQAAHLSPENYDIRFHLGMALLQAGQSEGALSQLEAAERLEPGKAQVHSVLARILWSMGKEEQAQAESALAERLSSLKHRRDRASYCIAKGNALLDRGDLGGAEEQFRHATELNPRNAGARYNLGLVLARSNDQQGARREFLEAIALDPKLAPAYNALGLSYKKEGQYSEARADFLKAIRINPQYAEAKNNLGTLDAVQGKNAEAAALFEEATQDSPQYPTPYLNWGLLLANQDDLRGAKKMFEKALQLSPDLAQARKDIQLVNETLQKQN